MFLLPNCTPEAPYGLTDSGNRRKVPTKKQMQLLEKHGLTPEEYSGSANVRPPLSEARKEQARAAITSAREKRILIAEKKKKLLTEMYGSDWKEKGHKLSEISAQEALAGAIAANDEDSPELEQILHKQKAPGRVRASATVPDWAHAGFSTLEKTNQALLATVTTLTERLARVESKTEQTAGLASEAAGLVRKNSLERKRALEAAKQKRLATPPPPKEEPKKDQQPQHSVAAPAVAPPVEEEEIPIRPGRLF